MYKKQNTRGIRMPGAILDELRELHGSDKIKSRRDRDHKRREPPRKRQRRERTQSDDDWFGDDDDDGDATSVMAKLKAAKQGKRAESGADVMAQLKAAKANKSSSAMSASETMAALKAAKSGKTPAKPKDMSAAETMAALKAAKSKKKTMSAEDTMAALKAAKEQNKKKSKPQMSAEDTMAALKAAKDSKPKSAAEDVMDQLKAAKAKKSKKPNATEQLEALRAQSRKKVSSSGTSSNKSKKHDSARVFTQDDHIALAKEEMAMEYYAKKLGMKGMKLSKGDDGLDDILGDLDFEGFASGSETDESGAEYDDQEHSEEDESGDDGSDGELDSDELAELEEMEGLDSEEDMDSEDLKELEEMEGLDSGDEMESDELAELEEMEGLESGDGSDDDDDDEDEEEEAPAKENPYVAPGSTGKYVPPSLRAASGAVQESEEMRLLRRQVKGLLNRLSEPNMGSIVNEIETLYQKNSRHQVNEVITEIIIESTALQGVLQEQFLTVHAALATALYRNVGVEFGAYFIQTLVEKFEKAHEADSGKQAINLLSLISEVYSFQLVSSPLMFDLIKSFLQDIDETKTGYLLKIIRTSGPQLRSDDPGALKEIIYMLQIAVSKIEGGVNQRTKFLIETITELKNNRVSERNKSAVVIESRQRLRKKLAEISSKSNDSLQVTLDDIRNVKTRGKWWLVGAAWNSGGSLETGGKADSAAHGLDDILDSADTNWLELAKLQRMNTDIRRAVFVTLMSSEDYVDAADRLTKLNLKSKQEREIPNVVLHCCASEETYNPFYALVASRLCGTHSLKKTFQFQLWDYLSTFEPDDSDGESDDEPNSTESNLRKTMHFARFYSFLVAEGIMDLDILKHVDFLTGRSESNIFIELFLVSLYQTMGKRAEVPNQGGSIFGGLETQTRRNPDALIAIINKTKDKTVLAMIPKFQDLRGIANSTMVTGKKKALPMQRERVAWGVDVVAHAARSVASSRRDSF